MDNKRKANLILHEVCQRFRAAEIRELRAGGDYAILRLRDGRMYLARLNRNNALVLEELEAVC